MVNPRGSLKAEELSQLIYDVFTNGVNSSLLAGRQDGTGLQTAMETVMRAKTTYSEDHDPYGAAQ